MVAAILAGGESRRMGEPKAWLELGGRTLLARAADAARAAGLRPVVVAKAAMALPAVPDLERWDEPDEPRHPLTGLAAALARCGAEGCVALACDTPFVPPALLRALAECEARTFVRAGGRLHPLPGRWPGEPLPSGGPLLALPAAELAWPSEDDLLNVNSRSDLAAAAARQRRLGREPG